MKDMFNEKVINGDILVEGHEDHAYVFEVRNRKPILVALISVEEKLEKFTIEDINKLDEEINKSIDKGELGDDASFMRKYYKKMMERMEAITTNELAKAKDQSIFKKFVRENHKSIIYTEKLSVDYKKVTTAHFPDDIMVIEG